MKKTLIFTLFLLIVAASTAFPGGEKERSAEVKEAPGIALGFSSSISTLDGSLDAGRQTAGLVACLYDYLYMRDRDGKIQPDLALSHRLIDDLTWEISLRKGVKFHSGDEFGAKDVKLTLERILDPKSASPWRSYINLIASVEAVDPYTVRIKTSKPFPGLIENVMLIPIISKTSFEKVGADEFGRNPVGTGPFVFEKWVKGEYVVLKANNDYWRGTPPFGRVEIKQIVDDMARMAALKSGDVDIIVNVSPDLITEIKKDPNLEVKTVPSIRGMYVFIDTRTGPFKDVRVRQAINHLVDVDEIINTLLSDTGAKPINNLVPPMYSGHNKSLPIHPYPYNPDKAWELLKQAGYSKPFEIIFYGPIGRYLKDREIAQAVAGQLERHGFKVQYEGMEWGVYTKFFRTRKDQMDDKAVLVMLGYGAPHYDGATPWNEFMRDGSKVDLWKDGEFTKYLDDALSEMDKDKRNSLLNKGHQLLVERAPIIFLYQLGDVYALNKRIEWTPRNDELVWVWEASAKE